MTVAFLDVPSTGRAVMLLMVIVPTAVVGWIAAKFGAYRRIYAPECGDGQLQLDSLGLIVRLPGVLAEPVRFSEKSIEAVLVHTRADARPDRRGSYSEVRRRTHCGRSIGGRPFRFSPPYVSLRVSWWCSPPSSRFPTSRAARSFVRLSSQPLPRQRSCPAPLQSRPINPASPLD